MALSFLYSCNRHSVSDDSTLISQVKQTEKDFCEMVARKGLQKAFLVFADTDVVLLRNDSLLKGKMQLKAFYKNVDHPDSNIRLVWKPDFVKVSKSGDLAYTYGKYTFTRMDKKGISHSSSGIFHTIWKRQKDGSWKFVWD
jgi:ketosteroid isomerase-like protein